MSFCVTYLLYDFDKVYKSPKQLQKYKNWHNFVLNKERTINQQNINKSSKQNV